MVRISYKFFGFSYYTEAVGENLQLEGIAIAKHWKIFNVFSRSHDAKTRYRIQEQWQVLHLQEVLWLLQCREA